MARQARVHEVAFVVQLVFSGYRLRGPQYGECVVSWKVLGSAGAAGEQERSLRAMYDEHGDALFAYVVRLLGGDRYRAEDVVQETLLRCWRHQGLDHGRPMRPWLCTVARNVVIDAHRRRRIRPAEVLGSTWQDSVQAERDEIGQMLSSVVVRDALESLSAIHRQVLQETYFAGKTTQETADLLGIPVGTVKSRVFNALKGLRAALEERDVDVPAQRTKPNAMTPG